MTGGRDGSLAGRLREQLDRLPGLLERLDPERLERPAAAGGWSPRLIVAHLARHHEVMVERLGRILAEDEPALDRYAAERDPEWPRWQALALPALMERLLALRADLVHFVELLSDAQLARRGAHPLLGPLAIPEWLDFFLLHEAHHLYRLRLLVAGGPAGSRAATPRGAGVRVKVCCISSPEEAELAARAGASALGLVSHMPSGPGVIPETLIAAIAARVPPGISRVLLTSHRRADAVVGQQRRCGVDTLQLCDRMETGAYRHLREALPGVRLMQVVHVEGPASVEEAVRVAPEVDAILLDSGRPDQAVKELGGTGRIHDWSLSRQIRERIGIPLFLAGGLTARNAAEAIDVVRPWGVDVCSGVRRDGRLDPDRLAAFMEAVASAGSRAG